jgi:Flp pilus assembly protein TadD
MMDYRMYGLNPRGHHFTNLLFHTANVLLLFFLLRQMTGALWRSAFVAALFAWHPLHVESVAWASERKDVLSTFFWLLAMMAYVRFVGSQRGAPAKSEGRNPKAEIRKANIWYGLALFFFALGLMSKPMVVTLPCVLLLIDFWPLGRFQSPGVWRLVREKIPFFILTCAASVVTCLVQKGAESTLQELSFSSRLANAALAYVGYLSKTFWPAHLAAIYPLPRHVELGWLLLAILVLAGVSFWFAVRAKRQPFLLVGWLWLLGTLIPTIGLVQVGAQAMADRYMYIPSIGLFLLLVWGATALLDRWPAQRNVLIVAGGLSLIACLGLTRLQLRWWQDSVALFRHAAEVTADNEIAYDHLAKALMDQGKLEEAGEYFAKALRLVPGDAEAHYKLGSVRLFQSRLDEAIVQFSEALRLHPDYAEAHRNIAVALMRQGKPRDGAAHFSEALRINPGNPEAHFNLGVAHLELNEPAAAAKCFVDALRLQPDAPKTQYHLALALAAQPDRSNEALAAAEKARAMALAAGQADLAAKAQELLQQHAAGNPKSEGRNPKETRNPKPE